MRLEGHQSRRRVATSGFYVALGPNFAMSSAPIPWKHVRNVLVLFAPLWGGAAILFGVMGIAYSLFSSDVWTARQPLVVRDQAGGAIDRLGRFGSTTELKAAQETILEMAQNPEVVGAALRMIGPPSGFADPQWPPTSVIDSVASDAVNIRAPQGSEFGNSEVIYLEVKSKSPERVDAFCRAMYEQLTQHHRTVRRVRADSLITELTHARDLAKQNLDEAASRMRLIEIQFGSDLGELRSLSDTISSDGATRRALEQTVSELQIAELDLEKLESLHGLLIAGSKDPTALVISGGDLLSSQPSLQRLKDGLIDAQLETSRMSGNYTELHPKRRAAMSAETEIKNRIQQETLAVIRAMQPTLSLERERVQRLSSKHDELSRRLSKLADVRTDYAKLDAAVRQRTTLLGECEKALSDAQASRSAAMSTNLIAELGPPQVGDSPLGPSGLVLTFGSTMAGLIFGLGTVFLVAPGPTEMRSGRRWSDYLSAGRRASDVATAPKPPRETITEPPPTGDRRRTN